MKKNKKKKTKCVYLNRGYLGNAEEEQEQEGEQEEQEDEQEEEQDEMWLPQ